MGLFSWLTSGTKAAEDAMEIGKNITTGVISGIDAIFYTDEEKAVAQADRAKLILEYWKTFAAENSTRSVTRRILAVMSFIVFFGLTIFAVVVYKFDSGYSAFVFGIIKELFWLWMMIAATYFVPHQLQKLMKDKNG